MHAILLIGALPPPVNGMALVTQAVFRMVSAQAEVRVCNVSPTALYDSHRVLGILVKLLRYMLLWLRLPYFRVRGSKVAYMPLDSRLGLIFNIITVAIGRVLGMRFVLHHHVANYVVQPTAKMRCLNALTTARDLQIFNCENLLSKFSAAYPLHSSVQHISNSGLIDLEVVQATEVQQDDEAPLVIGLMSVLTIEKGLGILLDLLNTIVRQELNIRVVIAGPVFQVEAQRRLEAATKEYGKYLDYRGAISGEQKAKFFADIDVFVFPTRYRLETEPLVIIEALSHQRPVVAYDRGCIGEIVGETGGSIIDSESDFVGSSLKVLKHYAADRQALRAAKIAAGERAQNRIDRAHAASKQLLEALTGSE